MSKIIIGNWKLNPLTVQEAEELAAKLDQFPAHTTIICPPTAYLGRVKYPNLGAQDVFWKLKGPCTGQTSASALKSLGVKYCLVGHSERRSLGETDQQIAEKIMVLQSSGITPVLCVGYGTTVEQDELEVTDVIKSQLNTALQEANPQKLFVAYEPVWSISSGNPYETKKVASPEHAEKISLYIKTKFNVPVVLYGGSVTSVNAQSFLQQNNIGGLLVGGASLLADDFNKIINTEL